MCALSIASFESAPTTVTRSVIFSAFFLPPTSTAKYIDFQIFYVEQLPIVVTKLKIVNIYIYIDACVI